MYITDMSKMGRNSCCIDRWSVRGLFGPPLPLSKTQGSDVDFLQTINFPSMSRFNRLARADRFSAARSPEVVGALPSFLNARVHRTPGLEPP